IVDFMNANPIKYVLTVNPTIYTSCIQQFWDSAKVKTVNEDVHIRALVYGKKIIVTEASIRCDLQLQDAEEDGVKFFMFSKFVQVFVNHQLGDMSHHKKIFATPSLTKKVFANMKREENSFSGIITPLFETMMVQLTELMNLCTNLQKPVLDLEKAKTAQAKEIADLKKRGRMNEEDMFRVNDLDGDEVIVDATVGEEVKQSTKVAKKEVSTADPVTTIEIKAAKPKAIGVTVQELSEFRTTSSSQPSQLLQAKDKGKGIMVEPGKLLKKKDQIAFDEEVERKLEAMMKAEMEEEERIAREKDEANIVVNTFVDINTKIVEERKKKTQTEVTECGSKRAGDELEQESTKRQRLGKEDDSIELKKCLEIIPEEDDDDVTIEATLLSSKSPTIVNYKIYKKGKKSYFKIIRADGNSQSYLTFGKMFKNFNREDLEVLWSIVKERFKKTKPVDYMDNLLFQTLKTMLEHHVEVNIWRYPQGIVKVLNWKLFNSCEVYCVTTQNMVHYLLVEKMYPFTKNILHQM
nr:hypothetical protein [Tanacetum cinerariifolium]